MRMSLTTFQTHCFTEAGERTRYHWFYGSAKHEAYDPLSGVPKEVERAGYLSTGPHNIVAVDWSYYSKGPWFCYPVAVANIRHTGQCVAQLIEALRGAGCGDIHLVGFSLGAHVPAFTANYMRPYQIPRITGLDPAMPLFESRSKDSKLDAGDALFVDIVHTNAFMQGKFERCGHVDFYMNGGVNQPGCYSDGGENIRGYYIVETSSQSPYALGEWTGPLMPSS
uniref:Lipase domain-containing protein n=1 Tax=Timema genevievae TaxID=629358 RepID=A0A7R9JP08_TIMGE|nr:unnamed protein product [Timema genevievae]